MAHSRSRGSRFEEMDLPIPQLYSHGDLTHNKRWNVCLPSLPISHHVAIGRCPCCDEVIAAGEAVQETTRCQ